jgi:hypothetical protein
MSAALVPCPFSSPSYPYLLRIFLTQSGLIYTLPALEVFMPDIPSDLITVAEARKILSVSKTKMSELIRTGTLTHFHNALDRREKLLSKAEVLALIPRRAEAA